ncbi:hypothetical protein CONLIGDRAFT_706264 [Coniochaeta ligniaria NRRL 30616]|uniref:Zn(2)-C6 fungal-type domain-containing protein n=1 Tax=Coniochaeta ligniaria NRRL 30616 TaxID=1408157 RepID=A0A1J7JAF3_9PEZI|nr:hypothetical protein CONLIGDRAFT_706264 [Coniochaeta ligniaria NRRL 30616]
MVYRGPSKGCKTCRIRRVRCDQRKPTCGNCPKQKLECPGYGDQFLHRHRDETMKTAKRSGSSVVAFQSLAETAILKSPVIPDDSFVPATQHRSLVLSSLLPGTQDVALNFFFLAYGSSLDIEATGSLFHLLPAMYATCAPSSPLALATAALAVNITGLWRLRGSDTTLARQLYAQAVTRVRETIMDTTQNRSDELLMATLVLESYDSVNREHQCNLSPSVHASGSGALLKHRAVLNYRNQLSQHLVLAIRNKYVQDALTGGQCVKDISDIWLDYGPLPQSPAASLDRLAFDVFQLRGSSRLASDRPSELSLPGNETSRGLVVSQSLALHEECARWIDSLPNRWHPVAVNRVDIHGSVKAAGMYGTTCHVYANLSIATVRNLHRVIELGVLQILSTFPHTLVEAVCNATGLPRPPNTLGRV